MKLSEHLSTEEIRCRCGCGFGEKPGDLKQAIIDIFEAIRAKIGRPITVTSGCRCQKHQQQLKEVNPNAAKNSPHCKGIALDLKPPGLSLTAFYQLCCAVVVEKTKNQGGVGIYYPAAGNFVHIDTGEGYPPMRRWTKP